MKKVRDQLLPSTQKTLRDVIAQTESEEALEPILRGNELKQELRIHLDEQNRADYERTKNELRALHGDIAYSEYAYQQAVSKIDQEDLKLIARWRDVPRPRTESGNIWLTLQEHLSDNDLTRLWSARVAELAAINYYKQMSASVTDISIQQLDPHSDAWKSHDLLVDDIPLDVKNSRRSYSSPESYSEHCVKHKEISGKAVRTEVGVVGTLSSYLTIQQVRGGETGTVTILGEVTRGQLSDLSRWVERQFAGTLTMVGLDRQKFLPGWIFEYPITQQPRRANAHEKATALLLRARKDGQIGTVPLWVAAFVNDRALVEPLFKNSCDPEIWELLRVLDDDLGISRRSLFLAILGFTLQRLKVHKTQYSPNQWTSWLYVDSHSSPLGLLDSQRYVANLIHTLDAIWSNAKDRLTAFHRFSLKHPAVLLGEDSSSGEWYTLIAYCGGWLRSGPKCGKNPIHLGETDWCQECHRLICSACGYCSKTCSLFEARLS